MAEFREPLHVVHGAASYLKTLVVPTAAPGTPALGHIFTTGNVLHFYNGTEDLSMVSNITALGGDLSGTHGSATVTAIRGAAIPAPAAGNNGYAVTYDHATSSFVYTDVSGFGAGLVEAEESARIAADTALGIRIDSEITARQAADAQEVIDRNAAIAAETTARADADTVLTNAIAVETTARQAADTTLTTNLAAEVTARESADTTLTTGLNAEITARTAADAQEVIDRNAAIAVETTARLAVATALNAEITARTDADTVLTNALAAETTARTDADTVLTNALAAETTARESMSLQTVYNQTTGGIANIKLATGKDFRITDNDDDLIYFGVDAETGQTTMTGPVAIQGNMTVSGELYVTGSTVQIDSTITSADHLELSPDGAVTGLKVAPGDGFNGLLVEVRGSNEANLLLSIDGSAIHIPEAVEQDSPVTLYQLQTSGTDSTQAIADAIAQEVIDRNAAIAAEATLRADADTVLTNALAAEVTNRTAADAAEVIARDAAILVETTRATGAEGTLTTNLNAEITARTAADTVLTNAIAAETTARTDADATLTANLAAEVTARQAADTTLTTNLAAEVTARIAAIAAEATLRADGDLASQTLAVSGDLSGNLPNPTVVKIQGISISATAPTAGQTLKATSGSAAQWTSAPAFTGTFVATDFTGAVDKTVSFAHGLTMVGNMLPQVTVYEDVSGAMKLVGGVDVEITTTQVILTVANNAAFKGSVHLLYV